MLFPEPAHHLFLSFDATRDRCACFTPLMESTTDC